jgi:hypothetical protein
MITYLFIFLASFCNAMCDTMCFNEFNSLFTHWGSFWSPWKSATIRKKILGTTLDGFHLFKFIMILFIAIACINYSQVLPKINIFGTRLYLDIPALFIIWGIGFETSRKIFKK